MIKRATLILLFLNGCDNGAPKNSPTKSVEGTQSEQVVSSDVADGVRFSAGTWGIMGWMENSDPATYPYIAAKAGESTDTVKLTQDDALMLPSEVFKAYFYHGIDDAELTFKNGKASGMIFRNGTAVKVLGTYTETKFHITIYDGPINQVIEGRLAG